MIKLPDFETGNGPVLMLNLLKFKDKAHYFEQYIPAFNDVVAKLGIGGVKVNLVTNVIANVIASDEDKWDAIAVVEYPDANAFKMIAESEAYHTIAEPHRLAALSDLKLFMTRRDEL
jgi:uncharacterized protein (DUF1330 family)